MDIDAFRALFAEQLGPINDRLTHIASDGTALVEVVDRMAASQNATNMNTTAEITSMKQELANLMSQVSELQAAKAATTMLFSAASGVNVNEVPVEHVANILASSPRHPERPEPTPPDAPTRPAPNLFPQFKPRPPDAASEAKEVEVLISKGRLYLDLCGISCNSEMAVMVISQYLGGSLASWFTNKTKTLGSSGGYRSLDEFAAALRLAAGIRDPVMVAREKLANLKQTGSVSKFRTEFSKHQAFLDENSGTSFTFWDGLKPPIRAALVGKCDVKTDHWEVIADLAERIDHELFNAARGGRSSFTPAIRSSSGPAPMDLNLVKPSHPRSRSSSPASRPPTPGPRPALKKLTDADREQLRKEGKCFKCRQPGHVAAECPTQPKN